MAILDTKGLPAGQYMQAWETGDRAASRREVLRQLDDGPPHLFSHFVYTGKDFAGDMKKLAADPTTQKWWANMEEVFHQDGTIH